MIAAITLERTGEWIAAGCVIAILSLLWKENRFYRVGEHLLMGLTVGFAFAATWYEILKPKWYEPWTSSISTSVLTRQIDYGGIIFGLSALLLGIGWYGMYFKKTEWAMRLVMGIVVGAGAGQAIRNQFSVQIPQLTSSFRSPVVVGDYSRSLNNTVFLIALITVFLYFFFSFDHKSPVMRVVSRVGRFWLMVGFGAYFGNTVMTRLSALIERVWFVVGDFFGSFFQ